MRDIIIHEILTKKIITIIRGYDSATCLEIAKALYDGGITMVEITFDQSNPNHLLSTAHSIQVLSDHFKEKLFIGAGTVLTKEQVDAAANAGAKYIISPNTDPEIITYTRKLNLVSLPGAYTPSEIVTAHHSGADFVKLFPIGEQGPAYIKSIKSPLSHIKLLAVGGITENNINAFLSAGAVGVGIGGTLINKEWIAKGEFHKITALAKRLVSAIM